MTTGLSVLSACGVPPSLAYEKAAGSDQKEAFRRWSHSSLLAVSALVCEELSAKLEVEISLDFSQLFAGDIVGRARAFGGMVKAGMDPLKAMTLSGLIVEDE